MKPSKETSMVLKGIQTEIGAGMVMFPKDEAERLFNVACKRAKAIIRNYQDGHGLFQLTANADLRNEMTERAELAREEAENKIIVARTGSL